MFKTRITEMLGVQIPILQGGMMWLSNAELASAVSNAGGLGIITALTCKTPKGLKSEIRKTRRLTDNPFAVNVSMLPGVISEDIYKGFFDEIIDEGVKVVETAGGNPEKYLPKLKRAGVKVIHKVPSIRHARKAEALGVDAVTIVGFESAGHPGMDDVTTLILIAKATEILKIPVIAAGGICNAKGFLAALCLGAEGILMGTRFLLSKECKAHPAIKEKLVALTERDTIIIERSIRNPRRVVSNKAALRAAEMENKGATIEELLGVTSGRWTERAFQEGDAEIGILSCGQALGLINEVEEVPAIIRDMVEGARNIYQRLGDILLSG